MQNLGGQAVYMMVQINSEIKTWLRWRNKTQEFLDQVDEIWKFKSRI